MSLEKNTLESDGNEWEEKLLEELEQSIKRGCITIKHIPINGIDGSGCGCSELRGLWEKKDYIARNLKELENSRKSSQNGIEDYERLSANCLKEFQSYSFLFSDLQKNNLILSNQNKDYYCARCGTKVPFDLFRTEIDI